MKGGVLSDIGMGAQIAMMVTVPLLTVVLVLQVAGIPTQEMAPVISVTLLGLAIGSGLMASRLPFIGPSLPLVLSSSFLFLQPNLAAAKIGGLPLILGMTLVTGTVQLLISPLIGLLRRLLTAEIGFVVLTIVGFELTTRGLLDFLTPDQPMLAEELALGWGCFALMYLIRLAAPLATTRFAIIIAMLTGLMASYLLGLFPELAREQIAASPWLGLPEFTIGKLAFNWDLALTYIFIAFVVTVGVIGIVSGVQRAADPNWERPDSRQLIRCNLITGASSLLSALCGGFGLAMSSTSVAVLINARDIVPRVGYATALVLLLFAFCPKLAMILIHTPDPLIAAILLYAGLLLILNGLRYLASSVHHPHTALTTTLALMFGLSHVVYLPLYQALPAAFRLFTGSGLALTFLAGITLQALSLIRERAEG